MRLFDSGSATTFGVTGLEKMQPASALPPSLPPTVPSSAWSLFFRESKEATLQSDLWPSSHASGRSSAKGAVKAVEPCLQPSDALGPAAMASSGAVPCNSTFPTKLGQPDVAQALHMLDGR